MENGVPIPNAKIFSYKSGKEGAFTGAVDSNGFAKAEISGETINLTGDAFRKMEIPAQSFYLITNMND